MLGCPCFGFFSVWSIPFHQGEVQLFPHVSDGQDPISRGQARMIVRRLCAFCGRRPLCSGHECGKARQSLGGWSVASLRPFQLSAPYTTLALSRDSWGGLLLCLMGLSVSCSAVVCLLYDHHSLGSACSRVLRQDAPPWSLGASSNQEPRFLLLAGSWPDPQVPG